MVRKREVLVVLALVPMILGAATAEGEAAAGSMDFLGKVVNFLILFGGLGYLLYKPTRAFLEKKSRGIEHEIEEAAFSRKEAEERLAAAGRRLEGLGREVANMRADAEARGRREKEAIAGLAREEAERIKRLTRQEIDARAKAGIRDVRAFVALKATSLARERIRKRLAAEDQAHLIDRSIERLSRLNEKSGSD
jgi:F-type H+-transporting ATPase subunit b